MDHMHPFLYFLFYVVVLKYVYNKSNSRPYKFKQYLLAPNVVIGFDNWYTLFTLDNDVEDIPLNAFCHEDQGQC